MSYRDDMINGVANILEKIEVDLDNIRCDLESIQGIDEIDSIRQAVEELIKKLY